MKRLGGRPNLPAWLPSSSSPAGPSVAEAALPPAAWLSMSAGSRSYPPLCSAACFAMPPPASAPTLTLPPPRPSERLRLTGRAGQKVELAQGFRGERTYRELQLSVGASAPPNSDRPIPLARSVEIPGEILAPELGLRLRIRGAGTATLRPWKPGDRVRLRHTAAPRKVKEVLERLHVSGSARADWPVLEVTPPQRQANESDGRKNLAGPRPTRIVWMQGVEVDPDPEVGIELVLIRDPDSGDAA